MNNEIFFSIIIINYNTCELTTKCIESIYQHLKNKVGYEIICFDNNSSDNSVEAIESRYPKVALIKNKENIGFGRANNYCFKLAKGKNILLLNTDSYLIDDSIIRMMEFLRSRRDIAVVGGALIYPEGGMQINFGKFPTFIFNNYYSRFIHKIAFKLWSLKNPLEVDYISGAYFLIKKEILDEVGYFDERFWKN